MNNIASMCIRVACHRVVQGSRSAGALGILPILQSHRVATPITQFRTHRNFSRGDEPESTLTKFYIWFLACPIFFLPYNWPWLKKLFLDVVLWRLPDVPASYLLDEGEEDE